MQADQRIREKDQPTGLRNMGNTCYFNCLLQVYFTLPNFVMKVLSFDSEAHMEQLKSMDCKESKPQSLTMKRVKSGLSLIKEL